MSCVSSLQIEKDIISAEQLMRNPIQTFNYAQHDRQYLKLMTNFAFERYKHERLIAAHVQFVHIDAQMAISGPPQHRIVTNEAACDCIVYTTVGIPCRHILSFREHNNIDLFDPAIVNDRWLKQKLISMSQIDYVLDDEPHVEVIPTTSQARITRKKKTPAQKFRMVQDKCNELCQRMAELPEAQFGEQYDLLCDFNANVKALTDVQNNEGNFLLFLK